jgi:integrase
MKRQRLTDRTVKALKRAAPGRRYEITDVEARGLGVRVNDEGRKTWVLITRLPGRKSASRLTLGEYPSITLAEARDKARDWRALVKKGHDPRVEEERQRLAEMRRQGNIFEAVCEAYFDDIKRRGLRRADEVEREVRGKFLPLWAKRPITDIDWHDVKGVIDAALRGGSTWQAHRWFAHASRLFGWARAQGTYGLTSSPCDGRRPSKIIGVKEPRTRVLDDDELRAVWRASGKVNYPLGPIIRMLILTGQRRSEVAEARWGEFDLDKKLWTIPVDRMKARAAHVVPLTDEVVAILRSLPRFTSGDHVFTTTAGAKAVNGFSKAKARFDAAVDAELGRAAPAWVLHDLRRTMRTHLSALPVSDKVAELVIGHTQKGLHRVYDQHAYLDEKRHALELWAARLRSIVEPPPKNVVPLRAEA